MARLKLGLLVECVPTVVDGSVTEVTNEFSGTGNIKHDAGLKNTDEEKKLDKSTSWDGLEGGETVGDVSELGSTQVDAAWKTNTGLLDKVSNNGKHGDTAVLDLNITETVELLLVTIGNKAKGIEEAKRRLCSELVLEGLDGGGGTGRLLGWCEGTGGGDKGGKDG